MRKKHPHVRGEDRWWGQCLRAPTETPPRAWGRRSFTTDPDTDCRNTPTCVGKTGRELLRGRIKKKHPHVRGEDLPRHQSHRPRQETPPRAWGRRPSPCASAATARNTPTCVGKTHHHARWHLRCKKHPHVRGEDSTPTRLRNRPGETPPRAWGRLSFSRSAASAQGNTPTCVGKTVSEIVHLPFSQKHPHVRGEDAASSSPRTAWPETPPRAWGRQLDQEQRRAP